MSYWVIHPPIKFFLDNLRGRAKGDVGGGRGGSPVKDKIGQKTVIQKIILSKEDLTILELRTSKILSLNWVPAS